MLRRDPLADPKPLLRRVYSYVAYRIGDGPDAEDVTSETLERALRYRGSYDPRKGSPVAWLLGIARRCLYERAVAAHVPLDSVELATASELEEDSVRRLTLVAALATLEERDRELLALVHELSDDDVRALLAEEASAAREASWGWE